MTLFFAAPDITFDRDGNEFACSPMGQFDNPLDAARSCATLHSSFSRSVYEVEDKLKSGLLVSSGPRRGAKCSGHRVVAKLGAAWDLLPKEEWDRLAAA